MYLKRVSLYGFKSFAGRVELDLSRGISGVVGPNGVGKSNLSDAIRWAMGEQSPRILRGSRMQDVIFSGAAGRRGLGYAEVSLVFDNSDHYLNVDFDEVTVTRKVYKSGESEYMLNGVQCRLRDVQDLFSGTGLGREAYSVVEQGKIDAVLSARPEERRAVFDEAAGIMKYRLRKRDAERRLVEVRANQLRVGDVAAELSRQLPTVHAQADQARAWRELSAALRELELDLLSQDMRLASVARERATRQIAALTAQTESAAAASARAEAEAETARLAVLKAEQGADSLHSALSEARGAAEREAGRHELARERLAAARARRQTIEDELKGAVARLAEAEGRARQAEADAQAATAEYAAAAAEMEHARAMALKVKQTREAADAGLDEAKAKLFDALSRCAELRSARAARETEARMGRARSERLTGEIDARQAELAGLEAEAAAALEALERARAAADAASREHEACQGEVKRAEAAVRSAAEDVARCNAELASLEAAYNSLAGLQRDYEGYGRAVRALLSNARWRQLGLIGAVAELIKAPADYEAAIEAALGGALQNIVATTADVATQAVYELKRLKAGRATFLPLDILRAQPAAGSDVPRKARGVIGLASELVTADPAHRVVVDYLLGRVLVVDNLESGTALARAGCRLRIATLDGDLISGSGAITGGERNDRQSGLMAGVRRLEELGERLARVRERAAGLTRAREEAQAAAGRAAAGLVAAEAALAEARGAQSDAEQRSQYLALKARSCQDTINSLQAQLAQLADEASSTADGAADDDKALAAAEEQRRELESVVAAMSEAAARARQDEAECGRNGADVAGRFASARERSTASRARLERAMGDVGELKAAATRLGEDLQAAAASIVVLEAELASAEETAAQAAATHAKVRAELDAAIATRSEASQLAAAAERAARAARRAETVLAEKLREASVEEARSAAEYEAARDRLTDTYAIEPDEALDRPTPVLSRDDICSQIDALRQQMEELGPVNHAAPEEAVALDERFSFLSEQLNDLEEAQNSLIEVVRECDRVCAEQFTTAFEQLRVEFSDVFTEIFGGGTADLVLDDPSAPLECGIDIVCQPPGKKLASMSLLSGGEKSLVAIALLFAIMRVKPSPVCVLDEIDAALDEANVARFVEMLKSVADTVQVIIVTHRKRTMECADTLFGVTMEEQGVSKVLSLAAPSYSR